MNPRIIPIAAFVIWSLICWRWYVCGIKAQCGPQSVEASSPIVASEPSASAQPDTTGQAAAQNAIQTTTANEATHAGSQPLAATSVAQHGLSSDIESAQVVAVEDHVLIHFPYGSTRRVDDKAIDAYLSELAQALIASGGNVTLIGHTDNIGDPASNKRMALQRAQHIKAILTKKGANSKQISCKSMGESKPLASNDNPTGRYKNRRVEVRLK